MAYRLQGIIIPNPKRLTRNIVEIAVEHLLMFGKTTKRTTKRKEQFVLEYQYLTQPQMNSIMALFDLNQVLKFSVDEGNLPIAETDVLMDVSALQFPPSGELYRENMQLILTEVV